MHERQSVELHLINCANSKVFLNENIFSASINSTNEGESHSASVRESLKRLISNEPLNSPLRMRFLLPNFKIKA